MVEADYATFRDNPKYTYRIASSLVAEHFPPKRHEEMLESTLGPFDDPGNDATEDRVDWIMTRRRRRDPVFRKKVLRVYGSRCAVCEFSARLQDQPLALEAAYQVA